MSTTTRLDRSPSPVASEAVLRQVFSPVTISVVLLLCWHLPVEEGFRYDREALIRGELWRLFTAHWVHITERHFWLNLAGVWLIWGSVGGAFSVWRWLGVILGGSLGITLPMYFLNERIIWYMGFSGILYSLFFAATFTLLCRQPKLALTLLAIVSAKLMYEAGTIPGDRSLTSAFIGANIVRFAHWYGAGVGSLFGIWFVRRDWLNERSSS